MKGLPFYLLLLLLLYAINLQSQDYLDPERNIRFGVKAGLNIANFHGNDADELNFEFKPGLCAGAVIRKRLSPRVSLQSEVLYTEKGSKANIDFFGEELDLEYSISYIELPVMMRINFYKENPTGLGLYFGTALAFKVKAEVSVSNYDNSYTTKLKYLKTVDFGLIAGFGLDFKAGQHIFGIDVRYTYGVPKLGDNDEPADMKNSCLTASMGILF